MRKKIGFQSVKYTVCTYLHTWITGIWTQIFLTFFYIKCNDITRSDANGLHLHSNSAELDAPYFGTYFTLYAVSLTELLCWSRAFHNTIAFHSKQVKSIEHFVTMTSLLLNWITQIWVWIGVVFFTLVNGLWQMFSMQKLFVVVCSTLPSFQVCTWSSGTTYI